MDAWYPRPARALPASRSPAYHDHQEVSIPRPLQDKSRLEQIRARFDAEVERFSRLETGQQATVDAPLVLDLVSQVAATQLASGGKVLDLGCGAGNFTLRLLQRVSPLDCVLVDLSQPMLERARERTAAMTSGQVETIQADMRCLSVAAASFDVLVAGAVLHHLRDDDDWRDMFTRLYHWLKPDGLLLVSDLVVFDDPAVQSVSWQRYGDYLTALGGPAYRDQVLEYIDAEDSPRSLSFQLDLLRAVGFRTSEVLHRNSVYAAYSARK